MAYQTPKTNWQASDVVQPADMNRIEQNIAELKKAATIDVADANGYFTTTPKTVESALQELGSAVTTGKSKIATAITSMGQSAASTDTYDTLSSKIRAISTDATAGTGDVLSGKTFYQGGSKKTGTMANNGAGGTVTPGTSNIVKPAGYYSSAITVLGDTNLVSDNIVAGKTIFGVMGKYPIFSLNISSGTLIYYTIPSSAFDVKVGTTYQNLISFTLAVTGTFWINLFFQSAGQQTVSTNFRILKNDSILSTFSTNGNYSSVVTANAGDTITVQGYNTTYTYHYQYVQIEGYLTFVNPLASNIVIY